MPWIDDLLNELGQASWFTKLDLRSGFHQTLSWPAEEFKTAFQTHFGQFEFVVMPFVLTRATRTFQEAMNLTLAPFLCKSVSVFFNDILIYSRSYEDPLDHVKVLDLLQADAWKLKLYKCEFAKGSISYMGHIIFASGAATDPANISVVRNWPSYFGQGCL